MPSPYDHGVTDAFNSGKKLSKANFDIIKNNSDNGIYRSIYYDRISDDLMIRKNKDGRHVLCYKDINGYGHAVNPKNFTTKYKNIKVKDPKSGEVITVNRNIGYTGKGSNFTLRNDINRYNTDKMVDGVMISGRDSTPKLFKDFDGNEVQRSDDIHTTINRNQHIKGYQPIDDYQSDDYKNQLLEKIYNQEIDRKMNSVRHTGFHNRKTQHEAALSIIFGKDNEN